MRSRIQTIEHVIYTAEAPEEMQRPSLELQKEYDRLKEEEERKAAELIIEREKFAHRPAKEHESRPHHIEPWAGGVIAGVGSRRV